MSMEYDKAYAKRTFAGGLSQLNELPLNDGNNLIRKARKKPSTIFRPGIFPAFSMMPYPSLILRRNKEHWHFIQKE